MKLKYSMGKGIIMDEYFEYLIERTRYYERFEFFREDTQKVKVGLDRSEQLKKEISVVELVLKQSQEKNGSGPKK
jgi:hypothetical protein